MKNFNRILLLVIAVIAIQSNILKAQESVSTLYFMNNSPMQHTLNPSFQPEYKLYVNIPGLSHNRLSLVNTNFAVKNVVYNDDAGKSILFIHPHGDKNKFYDMIKAAGPMLTTNVGINVLGFGFQGKNQKGYFTFGIDAKVDADINMPKDFFKLALYGTPDRHNPNYFDLKDFRINANAYLDVAFGYSHKFTEKWTFGGKLKLLYGVGNINVDFGKFDLEAGIDKWSVIGNGVINYAGPMEVVVPDILSDFEMPVFSDKVGDYMKPSGLGAGIDLGLTWKPIEQLKLSLAINDLGFISWFSNTTNMNCTMNYEFTGADLSQVEIKTFNIQSVTDSLLDAVLSSYTTAGTTVGYTTMTHMKLMFGAEANFLNNKLGVGVLSKTTLYGSRLMEEVTLAVTGRPAQWADITLSYSLLQGNFSTIGFGIGLRSGPIHWMISADYVPFTYAKYTPGYGTADVGKSIPVPYNTKGFNLAMGMNVVIMNKKDSDKDGVVDKRDLCPDTPLGVKVDSNGCPLDTDKDGVPDYLDECPNTPLQAYGTIDEKGCPKDTDGDGVHDYIDRCPDTPREAFAHIDEYGCPLDSDGDGVFDYMDECPNTPANVQVDAKGCPLDTDGDSVPDYLDECPDTPREAYNFIDEKGCPLDTDGDTIPDYLDDCPKLAGVPENKGCPEVTKEVRTLIEKALQGIQFETGKATIKSASHKLLNDIADQFISNPEYKIEIQGHTDNVGSAELNQTLSEKRANAVKDYLVGRGVAATRMTANGYGLTQPVADNATAAGRAKNRRVEFLISFEEVTIEVVKP